ncbi:hypothetical protein [Parabacteroides sp. ZJ-118]|uniref:hypothetical protein n=1 Tax=Parabacteroides sp. ZJ-118 TaxID=2709398 RepID=UPI0013EC4530|nr:hypothetical protein [Parabacteroides sp. ZJ-118]
MKLNKDFTFYRYGIDVRLANEDDSEFLLSLRTNEKLSRFIHPTDNDLEKQRKWMRDYKKREVEGLDYYFIYSFENIPFAANRIYDINETCATGGSWVCKPGTEAECSVSSLLIMRDVMFEILGLDYDKFDVRKGNKQVQKIHKMMGAEKVGETDLDYLYSLFKEDYFVRRNSIIELLNLTI